MSRPEPLIGRSGRELCPVSSLSMTSITESKDEDLAITLRSSLSSEVGRRRTRPRTRRIPRYPAPGILAGYTSGYASLPVNEDQ
jgi:hypothetical protein